MARKKMIVGDTAIPMQEVRMLSSGLTLVDLLYGGDHERNAYGLPLGHLILIGGDTQAGKSWHVLSFAGAIAMYNPDVKQRYYDVEGGLNIARAANVGLPTDVIVTPASNTIEAWMKNMNSFIADCAKEGVPGFYVLDSYGLLTSESDQKKTEAVDSSGYGTYVQKAFGQYLRTILDKLHAHNISLVVIMHKGYNLNNSGYGPLLKDNSSKVMDHTSRVRLNLKVVKKLTVTLDNSTAEIGAQVQLTAIKTLHGERSATIDLFIYNDYGACRWHIHIFFLHDKPKTGGVRRLKALFTKELLEELDLELPSGAISQTWVAEAASALRRKEFEDATDPKLIAFAKALDVAVVRTWRDYQLALDNQCYIRPKQVAEFAAALGKPDLAALMADSSEEAGE